MNFLDNVRTLLSKERQNKLRQVRICEKIINETSDSVSFKQLLACHKRIFSEGIVISNLDYNAKGMFRANADQLSLDNVYLGNIAGLYIKNARYWESSKDYFARDICLRQWQNAIIANLSAYSKTLTEKS